MREHEGDRTPMQISDRALRDAVGELTNMIGGAFKSLIPGTCFLSMPVLLEGNDYGVPSRAVVFEGAFVCEKQPLRVRLLIPNEHDALGSATETTEPVGAQTPMAPRILLVEAFAMASLTIRRLLTRLGYEDLTEVANGREALWYLKQQRFDLVITDWVMPEMDGLEFVQQIRDSPTGKKIIILVLTANGTTQDLLKAIKTGVDQYNIKPAKLETLQAKIEKLLPPKTQANLIKTPAVARTRHRYDHNNLYEN